MKTVEKGRDEIKDEQEEAALTDEVASREDEAVCEGDCEAGERAKTESAAS